MTHGVWSMHVAVWGAAVDWEMVGALGEWAGAIGTFAAIVWGFWSVRDQMRLSAFADFTKRYGEIVDKFPDEARVPPSEASNPGLPPEAWALAKRALRQYFNLCSEEFYLHAQGILDRATWSIWQRGIRDTCRNPLVAAGWRELRSEYGAYPQFCIFMDQATGSKLPPAG